MCCLERTPCMWQIGACVNIHRRLDRTKKRIKANVDENRVHNLECLKGGPVIASCDNSCVFAVVFFRSESSRELKCAKEIITSTMAIQMQPSFVLSEKFEKLRFTRYESQTSVDSGTMSSSIPSTPTSPQEYEIQIATIDDKEEVLKFLQTFFFKDEPLNKYLGLITDDRPRCIELEEFALKEMDNNLNLKAVQNGKLIGVCLNGILERGYINCPSPTCNDDRFSVIVSLLDHVAKESDVFSKFPDSDKALTTKIISVDDSYRGKGIARELMAKTRDLAKEQGCGFMTVDCTSHFTGLALAKLGFQLSYALNYADYKIDGKVALKPAPPHAAVTVYTQKIQ